MFLLCAHIVFIFRIQKEALSDKPASAGGSISWKWGRWKQKQVTQWCSGYFDLSARGMPWNATRDKGKQNLLCCIDSVLPPKNLDCSCFYFILFIFLFFCFVSLSYPSYWELKQKIVSYLEEAERESSSFWREMLFHIDSRSGIDLWL